MPEEVTFGLVDDAHPELFDIRAMRPQTDKKPGQLTEKQLRQFYEEVRFYTQI